MLFDTDILVWVFRGNNKAATLIEETPERQISVVTFMELLQGSRDRREAKVIKDFLVDFSLQMLPLTENIGHRAAIYMEEYSLNAGLCMGDALVAATAISSFISPIFTPFSPYMNNSGLNRDSRCAGSSPAGGIGKIACIYQDFLDFCHQIATIPKLFRTNFGQEFEPPALYINSTFDRI